MIWLLIALNLLLLLVAQSVLAAALLPRRGNILWAITFVVISALLWLGPQALNIFVFHQPSLLLSLALTNWLVTACGLLVFGEAARAAPTSMLDAAAMDGCGFVGTYRHIGFPLVRRSLVPLAVLALVLSALELARPFFRLNDEAALATNFGLLAGASLLAAAPLLALLSLRPRPVC